jgi:hypothetical protein
LQGQKETSNFPPATRVTIIASDAADEVKNACLAQGADGFVSKRNCSLELPREIDRVLFSADPDPTFPQTRKGFHNIKRPAALTMV